MGKPSAGRRRLHPGTIAAARRRLLAKIRPLHTGEMKAMATDKAPWQTIYRIAKGITKNPKVEVLEEIERILGE